MNRFAQTNIQLYHQLGETGYTPADVAHVGAGYELALRLFTSAFRASGKPFVAHLVGTASILAAIRARPAVVAAGLLHAAYDQGEWGNGWAGAFPARRTALADAVGADAEDLVARYHRLAWTRDSVPAIRARVGALTEAEREVVLMRLANDLDDHLDLGILYCADAESRRERMRSCRTASVEMADELGVPILRDELAAAYAEVDKAELPAALRRGQRVSFRVAPATHWTSPRVVVSHLLARKPWR